MMKTSSRIYDYKGFKIKNVPYGNEPRWFVYDEDMTRIKLIYPCGTLKEAKKGIDQIRKEV